MKIQLLRRMQGLTQTDLAKMCETTQQQIAKIEGGVVDPKLSTLRKISESLSVELGDLFYKKSEFAKEINDLIREEGLEKSQLALASLSELAFEIKRIPRYHPYWESIRLENNKVFFMEEEDV